MNLFWHLFKNDLRRLWPALALWLVTALIVYPAGLYLFLLGSSFWPFGDVGFYFFGYWVLSLSLLAGIMQTDPSFGVSEFWMTRPIPPYLLYGVKLTEVLIVGLLLLSGFHAIFLFLQGFSGDEVVTALRHFVPVLAMIVGIVIVVASMTRGLGRFWSAFILLALAMLVFQFWPKFTGLLDTTEGSAEVARAGRLIKTLFVAVGALVIVGLQYRHRLRRYTLAALLGLLVCAVALGHLWKWPLPGLHAPSKVEIATWKTQVSLSSSESKPGDFTSVRVKVEAPSGEIAEIDGKEGKTIWPDGTTTLLTEGVVDARYVGLSAALRSALGSDVTVASIEENGESETNLVIRPLSGKGRPAHLSGQFTGKRLRMVSLGTARLAKGASISGHGYKVRVREILLEGELSRLSIAYYRPSYTDNRRTFAAPLVVLVNRARNEAWLLSPGGDNNFTNSAFPSLDGGTVTWDLRSHRELVRSRIPADHAWLRGAEIQIFAAVPMGPLVIPFSYPGR